MDKTMDTVMADERYIDEKFKQLHQDLSVIKDAINSFTVKFALFEEHRNSTAEKLADMKANLKASEIKIEQLENSLAYYKGAIAVLYLLTVPILGAVIGLIVKIILSQSN